MTPKTACASADITRQIQRKTILLFELEDVLDHHSELLLTISQCPSLTNLSGHEKTSCPAKCWPLLCILAGLCSEMHLIHWWHGTMFSESHVRRFLKSCLRGVLLRLLRCAKDQSRFKKSTALSTRKGKKPARLPSWHCQLIFDSQLRFFLLLPWFLIDFATVSNFNFIQFHRLWWSLLAWSKHHVVAFVIGVFYRDLLVRFASKSMCTFFLLQSRGWGGVHKVWQLCRGTCKFFFQCVKPRFVQFNFGTLDWFPVWPWGFAVFALKIECVHLFVTWKRSANFATLLFFVFFLWIFEFSNFPFLSSFSNSSFSNFLKNSLFFFVSLVPPYCLLTLPLPRGRPCQLCPRPCWASAVEAKSFRFALRKRRTTQRRRLAFFFFVCCLLFFFKSWKKSFWKEFRYNLLHVTNEAKWTASGWTRRHRLRRSIEK